MTVLRSAIALLLLSCAQAQDQPLTKAAIIEMSRTGVSEDTIVGKIDSGAGVPGLRAGDFIEMRAAGVSEPVLHALAASAPFHPAAGSGLAYRFTAPKLEMTIATVNVEDEARGYWIESRIGINKDGTVSNLVTKELIAGAPPKPLVRITQVDNLKPIEMPVRASAGARRGPGISLMLLTALTGALDAMQATAAQRQVQAAARPIRNDADRLRYAGAATPHVDPPQPAPAAPAGAAAQNGAGPAVATGEVGWPANTAKVGSGPLTVPAGTFECDHYAGDSNGRHVEVWTSDSTPGTGLVKLVETLPGGETRTVELQRVFENEKSRITGTPFKLK